MRQQWHTASSHLFRHVAEFRGNISFFKKQGDYSSCFQQGVVSIDLANNYGPPYGSAESTFGKVMKEDLMPYRDELFISTKAGYDMWKGPYGNWGSRKYLMASLNQSLKRMNLDYVDVFYSHRYDPETPLQETLQALTDIVKSGKAMYVGISRWPYEALEFASSYLAERDVPCLLLQDKLNILDREPIESSTLSLAHKTGMGFIGFSPLAQGLLTDRYLNGIPADSRIAIGSHLDKSRLSEEFLLKLNKLNEIAKNRQQTLAQMALAWVLCHKEVTSVIVGCSRISQLDDSLKCLQNLDFSDEELRMIDAIAAGQK